MRVASRVRARPSTAPARRGGRENRDGNPQMSGVWRGGSRPPPPNPRRAGGAKKPDQKKKGGEAGGPPPPAEEEIKPDHPKVAKKPRHSRHRRHFTATEEVRR